MATENALIDGALRNWHSNMDRVGRFFRSLSDDDLQKEIAPGKNRLIYIWGHLSATNDRMIPLLGFGERRYPELDLIFISQPDRAVPHNFAGEAIGDMWGQLGDLLWSEFAKLTPAEWLDRHQAVSPEDFEREPHRNRYAILLGRTTHLAYHLGQAILVKR
jgi:DinB superfamily